MNFFASWVFRCPKWIYFKLKYPDLERIDPKVKKAGNLGEKIALNFLKERYRLYPTRKRKLHFDSFNITGKPDFRVLGKNRFEIVEVKRVSNITRIPKKRWIAQLNLYLEMEGLKNGFILEISKNKIRKSKWKFNQLLFERSIEFYEGVYNIIKKGEIPPGRVGECFNCSYKELCRELCFSHR
jgi:CRISPR-associated exonuclease Cas4